MALPFQGLKAIDLASYFAGPSASTILSDFGCEITKVEPPEGDAIRILQANGETFFFELEGRGRRSLALDLKDKKGLEALYRLVSRSDIVVVNTPLPARARLGIDAESLLKVNPRLIYASVTAYGEAGPDAPKPGFDATAYWARSGLQDMIRPDYNGPPATPTAAVGDHPTAVSMFAAIAMALYNREKTGKGCVVSTSLLANGIWSMSAALQGVLNERELRTPKPRTEALSALFNMYKCKCGRWINLSVLNEKLIPPFARALNCPEIATDSRFATKELRVEHAQALVAILDSAFAKVDRDEIARKFDADSVTYGLIASLHDVAKDEQSYAIGAITPFADGKGMTVGTPIQMAGVQKRAPSRAPAIGQHTDEALKELGYSAEEIAALRKSGAAGSAAERAKL